MKITTITVQWTERHQCDDGVIAEAGLAITAELADGDNLDRVRDKEDYLFLVQDEIQDLFDLARDSVMDRILAVLRLHLRPEGRTKPRRWGLSRRRVSGPGDRASLR